MAVIGYVTVFVRDFSRAVDFYEKTLGLPLAMRHDEFGYASFATGGARLALAEIDPNAADQAALVGRHTGVGVCVEDMEEAYQKLRAKGVEFPMPPSKQPWGGMLALFRDSEGNILYLDEIDSE